MAIARRGTPTTTAMTSSAASLSINVPAAVVNGDLMLLAVMGGLSSAVFTDPTGWTRLDAGGPGTFRGAVWARIAASEPASYTVSFTSDKYVAAMAAWSGVDTSSVANAVPGHSLKAETVAGTSHTTNSVTAVANEWLVSVFADRSTSAGTKNTNWTATSPAIEWTEVNNNAAASSPWVALELNDSNGAVAAGTYSHTSVSVISQSNAIMFIARLAPAPSGSSFTQAATDSIGISESLARTVTFPRALSETLTVSESPTRTLALPRALTDALSVTDAANRTMGHTVTATDALSITEAATRSAQALSRTATDSIAIGEAVTGPVGRPRTATDALSITDAATRSALANPRPMTDTVTVADNATSNGGGTPASTLINLPKTGAGQ